MNAEPDANEFRSSVLAWTRVLTADVNTAEPNPQLVAEWLRFVPEAEAKAVAASGIPPNLLAEAIANGFQPEDQQPDALSVLRARAAGHLAHPLERSSARQLAIALIDFSRKEHCALVQPAINISKHTHLALADAVFLLKKTHREQQIVAVLHGRPDATAAEIHELLRFGSTSRDWQSLSVSPSTRRLLQRSGITPDQYEAWAKLGVTAQDEILDAAQTWEPADAKTWMTALNMPHREVAAWFSRGHDLRLAKAWISLGYTAARASELEAQGVAPAEAKVWASLGVCEVEAITAHKAVWSPDELAKWNDWDAPEALIWSRSFDHPEEAGQWRQAGIPAELASDLAEHGWSPEQTQSHNPEKLQAALGVAAPEDPFEVALARAELWQSLATRHAWVTALGADTPPTQLDDWYRSGLELESVAFLREKDQTPQDAELFRKLNITSAQEQEVVLMHFATPHELAAWLNAGCTQESAIRWNAAGYTSETAADWVDANATIDLATELSAQGATPKDWQSFSELGIEIGTAVAMTQKGLTPEKFLVWRNELPGLSALDVLAWFGTGGSLQEVTNWRAQGLTPVQASASNTSPEH